MASASSIGEDDQEILNLFASEDEESEFEGFDLEDMPLSLFARAHGGQRNERESDNEEDFDVLLDESDAEEPADETADVRDEQWSENFTPQTEVRFEQRPGPVRSLPADKKPIDFFQLFFSERLYRLIVRETNRYARQEEERLRKRLDWHELTANELKTWLGLYYKMGVVQKPTLHSYWEKNKVTETPGFGKIMSRDRFMNILRFLHFVDNNDELPSDHPDHDRLFKLRPFIDEIQRQFRQKLTKRHCKYTETDELCHSCDFSSLFLKFLNKLLL